MLKRKQQHSFVYQFKNSIKEAYKRNNIPRLNDISETILDLVAEAQDFRIKNRHLEPRALYKEVDQLLDLYTQVLGLIYRIEFHN